MKRHAKRISDMATKGKGFFLHVFVCACALLASSHRLPRMMLSVWSCIRASLRCRIDLIGVGRGDGGTVRQAEEQGDDDGGIDSSSQQ